MHRHYLAIMSLLLIFYSQGEGCLFAQTTAPKQLYETSDARYKEAYAPTHNSTSGIYTNVFSSVGRSVSVISNHSYSVGYKSSAVKYSPIGAAAPTQVATPVMRRSGTGYTGDSDDDDEGPALDNNAGDPDNKNHLESPLGSPMVLAILAFLYVGVRAFRKKDGTEMVAE